MKLGASMKLGVHSISKLVPTLSNQFSKGQCGKVGVVGGCTEFTGAPYFAAYSALKAGADLSFVFCAPEAALPIKSYSPELMVHPSLVSRASYQQQAGQDSVESALTAAFDSSRAWLKHIDALVLGPGLGRDELTMQSVIRMIKHSISLEKTLVLDADAIWVLTQSQGADLLDGYTAVLLTPNQGEFTRLWDKFCPGQTKLDSPPTGGLDELRQQFPLGGLVSADHPLCRETAHLARAMGGVTILRKGAVDVISNGSHACFGPLAVSMPRRCGGQGDILAGMCGLFASWSRAYVYRQTPALSANTVEGTKPLLWTAVSLPAENGNSTATEGYTGLLASAYAASFVTRHCAAQAFRQNGRSTTTTNIISSISAVMETLFPIDFSKL